MPKASSSTSPPTSSILKRNQACHQCRRRKLKCDTLSPCGPCTRSHAHSSKTNPRLAFEEPDCTYDTPEQISEGSKGKIARLELRINELETLLEQKDSELRACTCRRAGGSANPKSIQPDAGSLAGLLPELSSTITPSGTIPVNATLITPDVLEQPSITKQNSGSIGILSPLLSPSVSPPLVISSPTAGLSQLTYHTWPLNIPPPDLLHHLVETFFNSVPLATRLIHRPTFMANLQQVPTSRDFPHVTLLHAICGIASLYSPIIRDPPAKNYDPSNLATATFHSAVLLRKYGNGITGQFFPRKWEDVMGDDKDSFGESHIKWCVATHRMAMQKGDRLLQLLQAAVIAAWYSYTAGRAVNAFGWIGSATRTVLPLGIWSSPGYEPLSRLPARNLLVLQDPNSRVDVELPRNLFWIVYSMERVYTATTTWPLTLTDEDISQVMPCRLSDFNSGTYVPDHGRQRLFTPKMLTTHPPLTTDSFTLYLKGSMLLAKVKSFNLRFKLRYTEGAIPISADISGSKVDARETAEFQVLDNLIRSFVASVPKEFKDAIPLELGVKLDPVLYTAHLLPHVAMILLHDPHADIGSPDCLSSQRILSSTRAIMDMLYKLCGTAYDLIYLDHSCSFSWFVAGAAIIRFMKASVNDGNTAEAEKFNQELGVVRFMLSNLGERTIIGLRQIKLLDDIYSLEIGTAVPHVSPTIRGAAF